MWLRGWPLVKLSGSSQVIPKSCPGCMKPSTREWRYSYAKPFPFWLLDRTRYFQTFYYCEDCSGSLGAFFKYQRWSAVLLFLMFPALLAAVVASAINFGKGGPLHEIGEKLGAPLLMGASGVLVLGLFAGLNQLLKGMFRKGLKPGATPFWGPSAFFIGDGMMGLGNPSTRVYRAYRPEWMCALAQANPSQVDEAAYQRLVGSAKPVVTENKPFAP